MQLQLASVVHLNSFKGTAVPIALHDGLDFFLVLRSLATDFKSVVVLLTLVALHENVWKSYNRNFGK
jgi:hypothetical protein